ncbi:MAG: hypothetical protein IPJ18_18765 [Betaproteobacteria bacterium]|nr:hypothetical protein [Betaproteobacteria bacterium]
MQSISSEIDSILREEIELAQKDDPALIVRSAFEVIEAFLKQGMSMERIASALQKHDIKVTKGHLVRHLGIVREERGLQPLKRGRKPRSPGASTQAPSMSDPQIQPPAPAKASSQPPSLPRQDADLVHRPACPLLQDVQSADSQKKANPPNFCKSNHISRRNQQAQIHRSERRTVGRHQDEHRRLSDRLQDHS